MVTKTISFKNENLWKDFIVDCKSKGKIASEIIEDFVSNYMGRKYASSFDEKRFSQLQEKISAEKNKISNSNLVISEYESELFMLQEIIKKRKEEEEEAEKIILQVQTEEKYTEQIRETNLTHREIFNFFDVRKGSFNSPKQLELQRRNYNNMFNDDLTVEQFNIKIEKAKKLIRDL